MNVMTFIFIQHSADREGHGERLIEKQGVHSTQGEVKKEKNLSFFSLPPTPPYFKAEAVKKSSRQLQVLLGKNHLLCGR